MSAASDPKVVIIGLDCAEPSLVFDRFADRLPNLSRLNYRVQASYELATPLSELVPSMVYAVAYSAVMIVIAVVLFSRRDFK